MHSPGQSFAGPSLLLLLEPKAWQGEGAGQSSGATKGAWRLGQQGQGSSSVDGEPKQVHGIRGPAPALSCSPDPLASFEVLCPPAPHSALDCPSAWWGSWAEHGPCQACPVLHPGIFSPSHRPLCEPAPRPSCTPVLADHFTDIDSGGPQAWSPPPQHLTASHTCLPIPPSCSDSSF